MVRRTAPAPHPCQAHPHRRAIAWVAAVALAGGTGFLWLRAVWSMRAVLVPAGLGPAGVLIAAATGLACVSGSAVAYAARPLRVHAALVALLVGTSVGSVTMITVGTMLGLDGPVIQGAGALVEGPVCARWLGWMVTVTSMVIVYGGAALGALAIRPAAATALSPAGNDAGPTARTGQCRRQEREG